MINKCKCRAECKLESIGGMENCARSKSRVVATFVFDSFPECISISRGDANEKRNQSQNARKLRRRGFTLSGSPALRLIFSPIGRASKYEALHCASP